MRVIDGGRGEGGGQVLRTALALSLIHREPVTLENIRGGRERPGLLRQHLAAVKLAALIGRAEVEGAEPGSRELTFRPRELVAGHHEISVGSAGSTMLVLQTVLPALLTAKGPSTLVLEGGTHNPLAPPFEFLVRAFVPLLHRMGAQVSLTLERPGFYPAGGGKVRVSIEPVARLAPLELLERGEVRSCSATALIAGVPSHVARRELVVLSHRLNWQDARLVTSELPADQGPGNTLSAVIESEHATEVFTGFGEKHLRAERVAEQVAKEVSDYLRANVPVGPQLADQLVLPLAIAGAGSFRTMPLTRHSQTQIELVREISGLPFEVTEQEGIVTVALR